MPHRCAPLASRVATLLFAAGLVFASWIATEI